MYVSSFSIRFLHNKFRFNQIKKEKYSKFPGVNSQNCRNKSTLQVVPKNLIPSNLTFLGEFHNSRYLGQVGTGNLKILVNPNTHVTSFSIRFLHNKFQCNRIKDEKYSKFQVPINRVLSVNFQNCRNISTIDCTKESDSVKTSLFQEFHNST